jgi:dienelactone hydrolase
MVVLGVGAKCVENFIDFQMTVPDHLARFGHEVDLLEVEALSSCGRNAGIIREAVMGLPDLKDGRRLVLVGYSKGAPDILEAIATYPELQQRVSAVVSIAGAVGGTPMANTVEQSTLNLLQYFPDAECDRVTKVLWKASNRRCASGGWQPTLACVDSLLLTCHIPRCRSYFFDTKIELR